MHLWVCKNLHPLYSGYFFLVVVLFSIVLYSSSRIHSSLLLRCLFILFLIPHSWIASAKFIQPLCFLRLSVFPTIELPLWTRAVILYCRSLLTVLNMKVFLPQWILLYKYYLVLHILGSTETYLAIIQISSFYGTLSCLFWMCNTL